MIFFPFFSITVRFSIRANIRTRQEIQCFLYKGFLCFSLQLLFFYFFLFVKQVLEAFLQYHYL